MAASNYDKDPRSNAQTDFICTLRDTYNMGFAKDMRGQLKVCGNCTHLRTPVYPSDELREACKEIAARRYSVPVEVLTVLIHEAIRLSGEKRRCTHGPYVWVHLLDQACAFWKPRST